MSCCGQRLSQLAPTPTPVSPSASNAGARSAAGLFSDPVFEYVGSTSLVVTGSVTGRAYRFDRPGARLVINRHDASSFVHVPNLRHLASR